MNQVFVENSFRAYPFMSTSRPIVQRLFISEEAIPDNCIVDLDLYIESKYKYDFKDPIRLKIIDSTKLSALVLTFGNTNINIEIEIPTTAAPFTSHRSQFCRIVINDIRELLRVLDLGSVNYITNGLVFPSKIIILPPLISKISLINTKQGTSIREIPVASRYSDTIGSYLEKQKEVPLIADAGNIELKSSQTISVVASPSTNSLEFRTANVCASKTSVTPPITSINGATASDILLVSNTPYVIIGLNTVTVVENPKIIDTKDVICTGEI